MNDATSPGELPTTGTAFRFPMLYSAAFVVAAFALSGWAWTQLAPEARVPIHWDANGKVNGYAGRGSLFLMPGLMVFEMLLFRFIPVFEPRKTNLMSSSKAYKAVWLGLITFLGAMHVVMILAALGRPVSMDRFAMTGIGVLFAVMGNFLGKVRSNFFFGVRTPWTLSSDLAWNKTHRLAGWMFVVFGAGLALASVLHIDGRLLMNALLGFVAVLIATVVPYSYLVWRKDPTRSPSAAPARTRS
ncbi:MAG TPA: SdpI family protein [Roseimicrobium sp.]|nr:SdpI family protein [Roseimicrobium sp.]